MILATARRRAARRAAFTLLEVLVVVAILVILAGVATVATTKYLEDARKNSAVLQCKTIANACESYFLNPNSNGNFPQSVQDLISPQWGGGSFLKDPQKDSVSPWGQPFQIQQYQADGQNQTVMVTTTAHDGTHISNFGTGANARW
jgi:general secretion pathway protein G